VRDPWNVVQGSDASLLELLGMTRGAGFGMLHVGLNFTIAYCVPSPALSATHGSIMPGKFFPGRFARLASISPLLLASNIFETEEQNARDSKAMTTVLYKHEISTEDSGLKGDASRMSMFILLS
jgi:hypothetical protein